MFQPFKINVGQIGINFPIPIFNLIGRNGGSFELSSDVYGLTQIDGRNRPKGKVFGQRVIFYRHTDVKERQSGSVCGFVREIQAAFVDHDVLSGEKAK